MARIPGLIIGLLVVSLLSPACGRSPAGQPDPGIWFFVLVKSSNHQQNPAGELTLLNYHFFSEIFPKEDYRDSIDAQMTRHDAPDTPMPYVDRGSNYYIEGGHFGTKSELDEAYPNGTFSFEISSALVDIDTALDLSGASGATDIPEPIRISLFQDDKPVDPTQVNATQALTVRWSEYSNGRPDPNGIVDDMIFVVVQDCKGERIVHTGLPFREQDYLTFRAKELVIEANTMRPGEQHAMFVEFPHVVDSVIADGVAGFTSYATATYLDIQTRGQADAAACLEDMPPMDTGQTEPAAQPDR